MSGTHRGGALAFGPDGKLYWGKGDNGAGANAQDLTTIHGKILRINPDGGTPSDNPVLPQGALLPFRHARADRAAERPLARVLFPEVCKNWLRLGPLVIGARAAPVVVTPATVA